MKDTRTRKWQITVNNPLEKGYTHKYIKAQLAEFKSCIFWCMSDEIGEEETPHTHIYMACSNAVRFSTIKNRFEGAHFEMAKGTSQQNKDYVFKEGKWKHDVKQDTNLKETHEEWGEMPIERQGQRNDMADLYDIIKQGYSDYQIMEETPTFLMNVDKIEKVRQIVINEQYKNTFRELEVTYIYGKTGSGKTRSIMEKYGYPNVFRVTDYQHPFDNYHGQNVVIFEEYRSSMKIQDMLNYLDGYPLELPCRYANKYACYTKVFLITNIPFEEQYENIQYTSPETWNAFKRRITTILFYDGKKINQEDYFEQMSLL